MTSEASRPNLKGHNIKHSQSLCDDVDLSVVCNLHIPCKYPWVICFVELMIYSLDASSSADTLKVA